MKVLVVIRRSPAQRFLVELHTDKLIKEVTALIARRRHSKAIVTALSRGKFERQVADNELPNIKADIILTEHNVNWDLTCK